MAIISVGFRVEVLADPPALTNLINVGPVCAGSFLLLATFRLAANSPKILSCRHLHLNKVISGYFLDSFVLTIR